jgi:hypothetical protein
MTTQPGLFDATIEDFQPGTRTDVCLGCGEPLDTGSKQERYCSPACRIWHSKRLRAFEGYLAPRPLPPEPDARRDIAKAIAAANNRWQLAIGRWAALMCFGQYEDRLRYTANLGVQSIASDVRAWCQRHDIELEWRKPWTGSLFQCAWFERVGTLRNAHHTASNARQVKEWRLTAAGREAYRAAKELMR